MNGLNREQRIHEPRPDRLATLNPTAAAVGPVVRPFTIPLPDARVQVKIAVFGSPLFTGTPVPYDVTFGGNITVQLWLAIAETDPNGILIPTVNLVGTRAAPQLIPTDIDVMGYSETVNADGDAVVGEVTFTHSGAGPGTPPITVWWLKTRYQPVSGALFEVREWQQIVGAASPRVPGTPLLAGALPP